MSFLNWFRGGPDPWMTRDKVAKKFIGAFPAERQARDGSVNPNDPPPKCGTCGAPLVFSTSGIWYCIASPCMEFVAHEAEDKPEDYFEALDDLTDEQQRIHKLEVSVAGLTNTLNETRLKITLAAEDLRRVERNYEPIWRRAYRFIRGGLIR